MSKLWKSVCSGLPLLPDMRLSGSVSSGMDAAARPKAEKQMDVHCFPDFRAFRANRLVSAAGGISHHSERLALSV